MSEIEAERNLYKGKYRALLKLIIRTRNKLVHVTDHIEDEGDRAYFGSTNDADALKALYREMMSWIWDATDETNRMKADPYATIREQRTRIAALEAENERLRGALQRIDEEDDTGPMMFEDLGEGRWQPVGGSKGPFSAIARAALEAAR